MVMLYAKNGRKADVVIRGARVLDPVEGVDATLDVRIDGGTIAELGTALDTNGKPVVAPGLIRRALQYSAVANRPLAVHCEEPTLSKGGQMHEGPVSAELGFAGYPSVAESLMVERDLALAAYEERPLHFLHLSARESVDAVRAAQSRGVQASAEVTPHHLCLTDEAVRSLD